MYQQGNNQSTPILKKSGFSSKERNYFLPLLLAIVGGALGLLLAFASYSGWFVDWKKIVVPPEKAVKLLASSSTKVWVQTSSGNIYFNPSSEDCTNDCWGKVASVPAEIPLEPGVRERKTETCVTQPLFLGAVNRISECRYEVWSYEDYVFALQPDGKIFLWHHSSGVEFPPMLLFITYGGLGAGIFFVIGLMSRH
jgi:hypothetical protein